MTQLSGSCTCAYVRNAIMTAPQASNALRAAISTPVACRGCPGASKTTATSRMVSNKPRVPAARSGSCGNSRIRFRLIETATNSRPVSAAAAPAEATARFAQSASWYALTAGLSRLVADRCDAVFCPEHSNSDEPVECHR